MPDIDALALPTGSPEGLRAQAGQFAHAAAAVAQTVLAREAPAGLGLAQAWTGPAHDAALTEAVTAARLVREVADRFAPAAAAVRGFTEALEAARRTVGALREEWLAADRQQAAATHQLPPITDLAAHLAQAAAADGRRDLVRADLLRRYAACMRSLAAAEAAAAHAISGTLGEAVSPAGQRLLLLAQLPLSQAMALQADAAALVDQALAGHPPDPLSWTMADIQQVIGALSGSLDDPMVARALMQRLGVQGLQSVTQTLWLSAGEPGPDLMPGERQTAQAALQALARAFTGSVAADSSGDPAHAAVVAQWRESWIGSLLAQPYAGLTGQMALIATAAATGRLPGVTYAAGALRALLLAPPPSGLFAMQTRWGDGYFARQIRPMPDPFAALLGSLTPDLALARGVLLARGAYGGTLVSDLVVERPLAAAGDPRRLESSEALGRLLLQLADAPGGTPGEQRHLADAVLGAVTDAGLRWWPLAGHESINVARHLDPLRRPAAVLLCADPARFWPAAGHAATGGSEQSARLGVLLGEIARDPDSVTGAPSSHTLMGVLAALAAFQADRLAQAMAASPIDPVTVDAEGRRIGYVVGFTASSATLSLVHAGRAVDSVNQTQRTVAHSAGDLAGLVPLPGGHPLAAAAGSLVDPAIDLALRAFDEAHPVDQADRAREGEYPLEAEAAALAGAAASAAVANRHGSDNAQFLGSERARASVPSGHQAALTANPARHRVP